MDYGDEQVVEAYINSSGWYKYYPVCSLYLYQQSENSVNNNNYVPWIGAMCCSSNRSATTSNREWLTWAKSQSCPKGWGHNTRFETSIAGVSDGCRIMSGLPVKSCDMIFELYRITLPLSASSTASGNFSHDNTVIDTRINGLRIERVPIYGYVTRYRDAWYNYYSTRVAKS